MAEKKLNRELEEKIQDYVDGSLNTTEIDDLWAELLQDEHSLDYLKTVASLKGLSNRQSRRNRNTFRIVPLKYWYAAAAVLMIAVSLSLFSIYSDSSAVTVEPIASIELDYYRSAGGGAGDAQGPEILLQAISIANSGDVDGAIYIIDSQVETLEDSDIKLELFITAGSIHYNFAQFEKAADKFERGLEIETDDLLLRERNYWYLGNTYFQLNKIVEARETLEKAQRLNGAYSRVAQSYLKALSE